jgi:hypothetical protein
VKVARQWALDIYELKKPQIKSLYKTDKLEPLGEHKLRSRQLIFITHWCVLMPLRKALLQDLKLGSGMYLIFLMSLPSYFLSL